MEANSKKSKREVVNIDKVINKAILVFAFVLVFPIAFYISSIFDTEENVLVVIENTEFEKSGIDKNSGLIIDDGYEIVNGTCSACHSISLVTQNSATREGWKDLIVWMQETQKLWDLGENEELILDYLEKNYAPKEQGRRAPLKDIDWYEL